MKPKELQIFKGTFGFTELHQVAEIIAKNLSEQVEPFCVWISGDLGAGKTTLVGSILHAFGLAIDTPVPSPTFTYVNEYQIASNYFAHLDLYRLIGERINLSEFLALDENIYRGFFIEWAHDAIGDGKSFPPTHVLAIDFFDGGQDRSKRTIEFKRLQL